MFDIFSNIKDTICLGVVGVFLLLSIGFGIAYKISDSRLNSANNTIIQMQQFAKDQEANMTKIAQDTNKTMTIYRTVYKDREVRIVEEGKKDANQSCEQAIRDIANYRSSI